MRGERGMPFMPCAAGASRRISADPALLRAFEIHREQEALP